MLGICRGVEKAAEILSQTAVLLECLLMMFVFRIVLPSVAIDLHGVSYISGSSINKRSMTGMLSVLRIKCNNFLYCASASTLSVFAVLTDSLLFCAALQCRQANPPPYRHMFQQHSWLHSLLPLFNLPVPCEDHRHFRASASS